MKAKVKKQYFTLTFEKLKGFKVHGKKEMERQFFSYRGAL